MYFVNNLFIFLNKKANPQKRKGFSLTCGLLHTSFVGFNHFLDHMTTDRTCLT